MQPDTTPYQSRASKNSRFVKHGPEPFDIRNALNRTALLRVLIVVGMLLAAYAIGMRPQPIVLALPIGVIGVVLLLKYPQLGFYIMIVGTLAVPFGIGTGSETSINAGILLLCALLFFWILDGFMNRTFSIQSHPTTLPLIAFLTVAVIALFTGQLPWFPKVDAAPMRAQLGGLGLFFLSAGAFWLGAFRVKKLAWVKGITWVFLAVGAFWVFGQIFPPTRELTYRLFERNSSGATGSVFWVWLIALALSQGLLNNTLSKGWRAALFALVAGAFYLTLIQNRDWTSGWLPALFTAGMVVWFGFPKLRIWLMVVAGIALFSKFAPQLESLVLTKDNDYSLLTRLAAATTLWQLIQHNPVLGFGPANYPFYTPLFNILGYNNLRFNSHNNYVDLVAETGFLGLFAFLWFAWVVGAHTRKIATRMPAGFPQAYIVGAFAGWVGTIVSGLLGDWFLPFVYNLGFPGFRSSMLAWLLAGCGIALGRIFSKAPIDSTDLMPPLPGSPPSVLSPDIRDATPTL